MSKNVGTVDRLFRIVVALVLAGVIVSNKVMGTTAIVLGVIAAVLLLTGLFRFCGLYALLGINTGCKNKDDNTKSGGCCCGK